MNVDEIIVEQQDQERVPRPEDDEEQQEEVEEGDDDADEDDEADEEEKVEGNGSLYDGGVAETVDSTLERRNATQADIVRIKTQFIHSFIHSCAWRVGLIILTFFSL